MINRSILDLLLGQLDRWFWLLLLDLFFHLLLHFLFLIIQVKPFEYFLSSFMLLILNYDNNLFFHFDLFLLHFFLFLLTQELFLVNNLDFGGIRSRKPGIILISRLLLFRLAPLLICSHCFKILKPFLLLLLLFLTLQ